MDWWVEIVGHRSVPQAVQESRRRAADEKAGTKDEALKKGGDEELGDKLKDKVKALLEILPKLNLEDKEGKDSVGADREGKAGEPAGAKSAAGEDPVAVKDPEAKKVVAEKPAAVAEGGDGNKKQEDNGDGSGEDKLSITVAMAGEILALSNDHLVFRPALQPGQELKLPLRKISSLSRHAPGQEPPDGGDKNLEFRVSLRDGSEIPGKLVRLTDDVIVVSLAGSGTELRRDGRPGWRPCG